jgi:hypothetical protein
MRCSVRAPEVASGIVDESPFRLISSARSRYVRWRDARSVGDTQDDQVVSLSFQQLVQLGIGERRAATVAKSEAAVAKAGDHRLERSRPTLTAVHVAGS